MNICLEKIEIYLIGLYLTLYILTLSEIKNCYTLINMCKMFMKKSVVNKRQVRIYEFICSDFIMVLFTKNKYNRGHAHK